MADEKASVLIVDDEQVVCDVLRDELRERGYLCITALDTNEAFHKLETQDFDVVLLDIRLPGMSGMEVLKTIHSAHHNAAAIMITAVSDVDTAVEAMKLGASDYIVKPFDLDRANISIHTALETGQATNKSPTEMDAIARGVEARLDPFHTYLKMLTESTTEIARALGIAEEEIHRWSAAKAMVDSERDKRIECSLDKLRRSPLAQAIMGMATAQVYPPRLNGPQN